MALRQNYSVWKFTWDHRVPTRMPQGARILSAQVQHGRVQLWALVDTEAPVVQRNVVPYGTGHPLPHGDPGKFVGTVQLDDGALVLHLFDQGES